MLADICDILLELHRGCRNSAADDFLGWATHLVGKVIPHHACFWGCGAWVNGEIVVHTNWMNNIPAESMLVWEQHKHADTTSARVLAHAGRVVNLTHAELRREYIYGPLYHPLGIEQILAIYFPNERTGLFDAISLYRSDPDTPFSEEERLVFESLTPHLVEARRVNYLSGMMSGVNDNAPMLRKSIAVADMKGVLHAADDDFLCLVRQEWQQWHGTALPEPLLAKIHAGDQQICAEKIVICCIRVNDMFLLKTRPRAALDNLSEREREIGQHFAKGKSHKVIAANFRISPATVRNHLSTVYRKLNVGSKAELAMLFAGTE